jgi:hypothetical protein
VRWFTAGDLLRRGASAAFLAAALLVPARAAACPGDPPALEPIPPAARAAFLSARLEASLPAARRWSWTWGTIDGALAVGQGIAAARTASAADRAVLLAGAATSAAGVAQIVLLPVAVPPPRPAPSADPCTIVLDLERALERGAENQAIGSGALAHLGNVLINAALGAAALAAAGPRAGALTFGIGTALGEAQIRTQPTPLVRDLARYRAGELGATPAPSPPVAVRPGPGAGLTLVVTL